MTNHTITLMLAFLIALAVLSPANAAVPKALIVQPANAVGDDLTGKLATEITAAGYSTESGTIDTLLDTNTSYDLIVLSDASALPIDAFNRFQSHFRTGGDIIALNTPIWRKLLVRKDGKWVDRDTLLTESSFQLPGKKLYDFSTQDARDWQRETGKADVLAIWGREKDPASGRTTLKVGLSDLQGMEFIVSPKVENAFALGSNLTVFSAKGGVHTSQLAVRWEETDGTRWISVVPLSGKWKQYILRPEDFKWNGGDVSRKDGVFNPQNAAHIAFGLSWGDTGQIVDSHEYWIDGVSTAADSNAYGGLYGGSVTPPDFDTLSPAYKLFDMSDVKKLTRHPGQTIIEVDGIPMPSSMMSPHQRPQGNGFDKGREWRFIPILRGATSSGEWRGTPATLTVYASGGFANSAWASFGIQDQAWYRNPASIKLIGDTARRMRDGVFIIDGGADLYTYTDKQPVRIGLRVANIGKGERKNLSAVVTVRDSRSGKTTVVKTWQIDLAPSSEQKVELNWIPKSWPKDGYTVTAELLEGNQLLDSVHHDIDVWKPKQKESFVSIKDGEFILDGKPWRANGVNYHPSSTVATWDWGLFLEWFGARSYDPEVIDRDLKHMRDMGLNAVSVQLLYGKPPKPDNLLDFLRRLDSYGMKANFAIPLSPMTSLNERWDEYRQVIDKFKLKDIDTIFAYDIDWEPTWLTTDYRQQWDKDWAGWIVERYGSVESAEKDWGVPVPRKADGTITNPSVPQTQSDGDWRRMSAAYRRFLGTMLYRQYGSARRMIKEIDPNHSVSFRMHAAGDGGSGWYGLLPYDWSYLGAAVDFFSPEAYTLGKTWDTNIKRGLFTSAYAEWANKKNPVVYAETGFNLFEYPGEAIPREGAQERQSTFYNDFYRMMRQGSINGVFWWWFPGGFRCMENSDYGIINPDGSDRPVTTLIRRMSKDFMKLSSLKPGKTLTVDPDAYISSSEAGSIYDQVKKDFWADIERGFMPVLASPEADSTSVNCPLIAVGNTPYNGSNPPKYLDAWFDKVEILDLDNKWVMIKKGDELTVDTSKPVYLRMRITNLGYAKWIAGTTVGTVSVSITGDSPASIGLPLDVPHLASIDIGPYVVIKEGDHQKRSITLRMDASNRARFGDVFSFTLRPK
ncbi:MAG: beta-galactosidase [Armatimonadota bacterium]